MASDVWEPPKSRRSRRTLQGQNEHSRRFRIDNAASQAGAMTDMLAAAVCPSTVIVDGETLVRDDAWVEDWGTGDTSQFVGEVTWRSQMSHHSRPNMQTGDDETSFQIGGDTLLVRTSIATTDYGTLSLPDRDGAINVSENGTVNGVEVVVPKLTFSKTHYIAEATVTDSYVKGLRGAVGFVNNATYLGFAAHELLLVSATGSRRGEADWAVTFDFVAGENKTGQTIAGITGVAYDAHDYVEVMYEKAEDATAKMIRTKARGVYVHQIYDEADFATILGV